MYMFYFSAQEADVVFLEEATPNPVLGPCTDAPWSNEQHCFQQVQQLSQKTISMAWRATAKK